MTSPPWHGDRHRTGQGSCMCPRVPAASRPAAATPKPPINEGATSCAGRPRVRPPLSPCGSRFARKVPSGKAFLATVLSKFAALAPVNIPTTSPPTGMEGCQIRLEVIVPGFVLYPGSVDGCEVRRCDPCALVRARVSRVCPVCVPAPPGVFLLVLTKPALPPCYQHAAAAAPKPPLRSPSV